MNYGKEFTKGILKENPTLVGLLGMCPTLAVTTGAFNGIGMGLSTMFVLICSNLVISLLRKFIPQQVKLPCYIVIIASFVTLIQFLVHGFVPALYTSLGAFLELITVNCIILGRAEMFACKNNPSPPFWTAPEWVWVSRWRCSSWAVSVRSWAAAHGSGWQFRAWQTTPSPCLSCRQAVSSCLASSSLWYAA